MTSRRYLEERDKHFDNYVSKPLDNYNSDAPRSRASLNIPEFSLVRETDQHNLSNAEEELSLLDKLATERDRVCTSKVVEEKIEGKRPELTTNEMKFSFNRNFTAGDETKGHFQPLSQLTNLEKEIENKGKDQLLGSIRRNKYEQVSGKLKQAEIQEALKKKIKEQQNNATSIVTTYLNKQKFESRKEYSKIDNYSSYKQTMKSSPKKEQTIKQLPNFIVQTSEVSIRLPPFQQMDENETAHYLCVLFDKLDSGKTGVLTKQNCFIQIIREEFKYVFGLVFSLIFLKNIPHNLQDFTREAINALNALKSPQIYKSLRDLDPLYHSNILKKRHGITSLLNKNWHEDRGVLQQRLTNRSQFHQNQTEGKTQKRSVTKYSTNIETDRQFRQGLSNAFYKLQVSPEIDRFEAELSRKMQLEAINRQPYVTLQETRYSNLSHNIHLNVTPTQFQTTPIRALQDSLALQETARTIKQTLHNRIDEYNLLQKQNFSEVQMNKKKKLRNISEQILREHKRSLQELLKLNEKMQNYLYRQVGQSQLTPHLFSPTKLRQL